GLYGFVTAFVVLIKLDLFGTMKVLTVGQGSFILAACLPIAFIGYYSAIKQASVAVSGISILAKRPDQFMKGVISAALVETYAAFAFLVSLLVLLQFNI
ncbi:MAG: permease, partial [Clostridia bacterium]